MWLVAAKFSWLRWRGYQNWIHVYANGNSRWQLVGVVLNHSGDVAGGVGSFTTLGRPNQRSVSNGPSPLRRFLEASLSRGNGSSGGIQPVRTGSIASSHGIL